MIEMSSWMWTGIWWLILFGIGFELGILYKGRKIRPIIAVLKNKDLKDDDKAKKIADIII